MKNIFNFLFCCWFIIHLGKIPNDNEDINKIFVLRSVSLFSIMFGMCVLFIFSFFNKIADELFFVVVIGSVIFFEATIYWNKRYIEIFEIYHERDEKNMKIIGFIFILFSIISVFNYMSSR